ncbi:MAG: ATP-binding cassette domain-containing protein, partial [Caulobacterales bacterium]|nr:ATP-binding cassette domain-containing protein [Caulobacterales bacterium]
MLHINDLTYRIDGRLLIEQATVALPDKTKAGLVGRNGAGKSTLLRLIKGEISPETGSVSLRKGARIGAVDQEAPGGPDTIMEVVLAADAERAALLAEAETAADPHRIADIQTRLADIDAHSAEARAAEVLVGLGFSQADLSRPCADFSGGWRMRAALAAVLFARPDLLLLDEPTNYLDLEGAVWLESHLRAYPGGALIISHDRDLLNAAADRIIHLRTRKLFAYQGGYDAFERQLAEQQRLQLKLKDRQEAERKRLQAFVDRFRAKATKARQAQSRVKRLEKMQPVATIVDDPVPPFQFPSPQRHIAPPLIRLEAAAAGYDPDTPILTGLDLRLDDDDRIGLLGRNGAGKSTLAKLLCRRLTPLAGHMRAHKKLQIAFFAQHQIDDLNPGESAADHVRARMPDATEAERRARLGAFGLSQAKADTPAGDLSGGEKARLLLNLVTFDGPHVLILDEPTNHLDMDARAALMDALNAFEGAVLLISHDRHLLEGCVDRLWLAADGAVAPFDDDLDAY